MDQSSSPSPWSSNGPGPADLGEVAPDERSYYEELGGSSAAEELAAEVAAEEQLPSSPFQADYAHHPRPAGPGNLQNEPPASSQKDAATPGQQKMTPLPYKQLTVLAFIVFAEPLNLTILFPFVVFMVEGFELTDDEDMVGLYVGIIASSFAAAQFISSIPWGRASDRFGRRPILLTGLLGGFFSMILFGLSKNLAWAICARILCGLLNGNVGVARSVLGEVTDATNQAAGFSIFGLVVGAGFIVGPLLGGLLSDIATKVPALEDSQFFLNNPYFLPCLVGGLISLTGFILGLFFLEETRKVKVNRRVSDNLKLKLVRSDGFTDNDSILEPEPEKSLCRQILTCSFSKRHKYTALEESKPTSSFSSLLKDRKVMLSVSVYAILALATIIFDEVYALWASSPVDQGGLAYGPEEIGFTLSVGGVSLIVSQILVFPFAQRFFGSKVVYILSMIVVIPVYLAFPYLSNLAVRGEDAAVVGILLTLICLRFLTNVLGFTSSMIFVNNSVTKDKLGAANGLALMFASLARACGPFLTGAIWSWTASYAVFPFDYHFVFFLLGLICLGGLLTALPLPKDINQPKPPVESRESSEVTLLLGNEVEYKTIRT